ncbi:hypothetical protein BO70DRAFT_230616 [Aspergillus heteromorphus CBS 117.55]|uniref:Uncharacterized protein n=1 Tax=Aspergillus heteromorphus CBS 117.55 TaxID=1448321 RepID=A0A317WG32_9EURO|nr:uncharacterized protein BO70DRAFT_230616 [Aspergillus heteromorphus CBS 117.55]PWY84925.1 hypothetical protein BO70DRAFT_230616 [Aspergillus heteromorphus CBS 117.55]
MDSSPSDPRNNPADPLRLVTQLDSARKSNKGRMDGWAGGRHSCTGHRPLARSVQERRERRESRRLLCRASDTRTAVAQNTAEKAKSRRIRKCAHPLAIASITWDTVCLDVKRYEDLHRTPLGLGKEPRLLKCVGFSPIYPLATMKVCVCVSTQSLDSAMLGITLNQGAAGGGVDSNRPGRGMPACQDPRRGWHHGMGR